MAFAPITLTIKKVPAALAARLKRRAETNRRSLQKELLSIIEAAAGERLGSYPDIAEPAHARYDAGPTAGRRGKPTRPEATGKLTLDQLWQRARKLGTGDAVESTAIIRRDRDGSHGR